MGQGRTNLCHGRAGQGKGRVGWGRKMVGGLHPSWGGARVEWGNARQAKDKGRVRARQGKARQGTVERLTIQLIYIVFAGHESIVDHANGTTNTMHLHFNSSNQQQLALMERGQRGRGWGIS